MAEEATKLEELLKSKTILLLQRERELVAFRQMHDRIGIWLKGFHDFTLGLQEVDEEAILTRWATLMLHGLDFQSAAALRMDPTAAKVTLVAGEPMSRIPATALMADGVRAFLLAEHHGTFDNSEPVALLEFTQVLGFDKFHWLAFTSRKGTEYLLMAGFSSPSGRSHPITRSDHSHFVMFGNHLAALLDRAILIAEVERERAELAEANTHLDKSLRDLRVSQEELIKSGRLAAVGEMAGRTAHEVLNPITSIQGRAAKMLRSQEAVFRANLNVFAAVVSGWRGSFGKGGVETLMTDLMQRVEAEGREKTILEDDLDTLSALIDYFSKIGIQHADGCRFLLQEVNRVVHIIEGMRRLTRHSSTRTRLSVLEILVESTATLKDSLDKCGITVHTECEGKLLVLVDRYELIQILTNLMRNSMLAIEERSGRSGGTITLSAMRRNDVVEIRVTDNGNGISAANLPKLFESGFTTRSAEVGTGLGLSISRRLARGFGGDLFFEHTEVGVGTTFLLEVPVWEEAAMDSFPEDPVHGPEKSDVPVRCLPQVSHPTRSR